MTMSCSILMLRLWTLSDGRQVTWAEDLVTGSATAFFYTEHSTNTGNTVS